MNVYVTTRFLCVAFLLCNLFRARWPLVQNKARINAENLLLLKSLGKPWQAVFREEVPKHKLVRAVSKLFHVQAVGSASKQENCPNFEAARNHKGTSVSQLKWSTRDQSSSGDKTNTFEILFDFDSAPSPPIYFLSLTVRRHLSKSKHETKTQRLQNAVIPNEQMDSNLLPIYRHELEPNGFMFCFETKQNSLSWSSPICSDLTS